MQYTISQYIEEFLIKRISLITLNADGSRRDDGQHYLSFFLIASGIEFLGACLDEKNFHDKTRGLSSKRFNDAIKFLFNKRYHNLKLYRELRCGLLHVTIPTKKIELMELQAKDISYHLKEYNDRTILIQECFLNDFKEACYKVIKKLKEKSIYKSDTVFFSDNNID